MRIFITRPLLTIFGVGFISSLIACSKPNPPIPEMNTEPSNSSVVLIELHPEGAVAGQMFNVQPSGASAVAATTKGAMNTTSIVFAGEKLNTVFGSEILLTAEVPPRLYGKPGRYEVYLQTGNQRSNVLIFQVR